MRRTVLVALGALAALATIAAALALALAIAGSGGDDAAPPATSYALDLQGERAQPARERAPAAPARPVPAVWQRPAAGPSFAIARLRDGARVRLWRRPGGGAAGWLRPRTEFGSPAILSVVRTRPGWLGVSTPRLPNGRLGWIRRDPARIEVYWTKYSLHADLSRSRLSLRYGARAVARFVVTVGATGTSTPTGRFGVTDALRFDASPYYGCCALALSGRQTSLPADWVGGDRLAIHGTPGPVGGAESHGCIRATDATMRLLFRRLPLGTPVFVEA